MPATDLDIWLPAIQAGDAVAFGSWMVTAEPSMRRALRSFAASVDTEAVLQEALLRVWQVAPTVRPDGRGNSLLRMGHRVAKNLALDEARRHRRWVVTDEPPEEVVAPRMPDPLLRSRIAECRAALPGPPARALAGRLDGAGGRHDRDLAAEVGMKLNTFLKNIGRARVLLVECLRRRGVEL